MGNKFSCPICNAGTVDVRVEIKGKKQKKTTKKALFSCFSFQVWPKIETVETSEEPDKIPPGRCFIYDLDKGATVQITFLTPETQISKTYQCRKGKGIIITTNQEIIESSYPKIQWLGDDGKDYEKEYEKLQEYNIEEDYLKRKHENNINEIDKNTKELKAREVENNKKELDQLKEKYGKK